jgi:alkanesulfonate monooxygenase SsuD/methylene tetrahydromethanopterin reductase-like flavin-dependent oxidoreductase (luciferase family)
MPLEYYGIEQAARFLAAITFRDGRTYRLIETRANGQPAVGDRPVGALFLLLLRQVLVAEQVGILASIAGGRFILQYAIASGRAQFDALAGGAVDGFSIEPATPDDLVVWIGAGAEPAIDRAARLGDA